MATAVQISKFGGTDVLEVVEVRVGDPGTGEARIRHEAIGLNFIDTYHRSGLYPHPLPGILGVEGAGVVEAVGAGVTHVRPGDRVVYAGSQLGAYASHRILPAWTLVKLPDAIGTDTAAAMFLAGLTVQYLFRQTFPLAGGETILIQAAAGGVGLIACQWARAIGVTTIGTVGSDDKAALAREHGCTHVVNYRREDFVARVREITGGKGVPVVYDGVGKDTFLGSLDCLSRRGMMVSYGNASGAVPPFSLAELSKRGSLFITRPSLFHYATTREELEPMAADLFALVAAGKIRVDVRQRYALADVARAHRELEARSTTGSSILVP
jgi:NADPH2:quinone reductase